MVALSVKFGGASVGGGDGVVTGDDGDGSGVEVAMVGEGMTLGGGVLFIGRCGGSGECAVMTTTVRVVVVVVAVSADGGMSGGVYGRNDAGVAGGWGVGVSGDGDSECVEAITAGVIEETSGMKMVEQQ